MSTANNATGLEYFSRLVAFESPIPSLQKLCNAAFRLLQCFAVLDGASRKSAVIDISPSEANDPVCQPQYSEKSIGIRWCQTNEALIGPPRPFRVLDDVLEERLSKNVRDRGFDGTPSRVGYRP
jgi:hypothetical protein